MEKGKPGTYCQPDQEKKVGMDWPHFTKANRECDTAGAADVESTRGQEERTS